MGKPKNKSKTKDAGSDSESEVIIDKAEEVENKAAKPSKKDKRKKKKDDDWEDDVANEIASMSLDTNKHNKQVEEEEDVKPVKKKEKKKKSKVVESEDEEEMDTVVERPKKAGGFSMLMMDDDDAKSMSDQEQSDKEEEVQETSKSQKKKDKKAKGKQEKKKTAEEEDIDALLAKIEKPKEGKKKKKKGKVEDEEGEKEGEEAQEVDMEAKAPKVVTMDDYDEDDEKKSKKKKKDKKEAPKGGEEQDGEAAEGDESGTVKSAAQKKKEKKERERLKKLEQNKKKQGQTDKKPAAGEEGEKKAEGSESLAEAAATDDTQANKPVEGGQDQEPEKGEGGEEEEGSKKKKKKKKGEKEEKEKPKKSKAPVGAIKELLRRQKEEEERLQREEEERIAREEAAIAAALEKKQLEEERRQRKKEKERERKERLKAEGKLLTAQQKQDRMRLQQMLAMREAEGLEIPDKKDEVVEVKKKRPIYDKKKKKPQQKQEASETVEETSGREESPTNDTPLPESPAQTPTEEVKELTEEVVVDVKDAWDVSSEEEEEEEPASPAAPVAEKPAVTKEESDDDDEEETDEEDEDDDEDGEEESSEESSSEDEDLTAYERAENKIRKWQEECEARRSTDKLRAPVVCVLGHVDTGKTKILDKLRRTNVQDGEAGGITQQIGATNVPAQAILDKTTMCKEFQKKGLKLPGLLIIDTPGHESFSNLRSRGSSLCDIAILVIDIMHGLEPQTIESINLLKDRKTPFVVALNKIDRLYQWKTNPNSDVVNTIKKQPQIAKQEFDERAQVVITQLAEQGLNSALYYENKNPKEYVSLIPTSAHSGDGMGNLLALICELTQTMLAKKVSYSEYLHSTVMEVKAIQGLGTTIDVILVNGKLREGDHIVIAGTEGPIVTQIRGLLMPQPMKELRVKGQYEHYKEVIAAQGVKIIGKDLEKALAGLPLYVARNEDEVEYYKEEISQALKDILNSIKLSERGVFVQASTLGSMEALLEFLRTSKIPYAGINIGPVHRKDIMKASIMLEHDDQWAVILAFDVKVEREAQEMADSLGVKIFTADIIYHLQDMFIKYREDLKKKKQEQYKNIAVFPCKLRVLPQFIFNSRDPIVVGVSVEAGLVKMGTPICVPSKEFVFLGVISSIENNHKPVDIARKGMEVCIKIENVPSETPKLYGRHFDHNDLLTSRISRDSIDAVKNYFRDEMQKTDWQLMVELKKLFQIL